MRLYLATIMMGLALALPAEAKKAKPRTPKAPAPIVSVTDLAAPVTQALRAKASGKRVIVVFDIDNTLLTTAQDLGGDFWFNWRRSDEEPDPSLLDDSALILQATAMKPTQPDAAAGVARLQAAGIPVYALTARGSGLRPATEDALLQAGIDLSRAPECGPPLCTKRGNIGPKEISYAARYLGVALPGPMRPVTVSDGVMMVSGQDKGLFLRLLLPSLGQRFDEVYFIDDTYKNVTNVQRASPHIAARVHIYSYERLWPDAHAFETDPARQKAAEDGLKQVKASVCAAIRSHHCGADIP